MKTLKFNTNINCAGCVASVTPHLNKIAETGNWNVDINNPNKQLTIRTDLEKMQVVEVIEKAGFKATFSDEL